MKLKTADETKRLRTTMNDCMDHVEASEALDRATAKLDHWREELEKTHLRSRRLDSETRKFLEGGCRTLPAMPDAELDSFAIRAAALDTMAAVEMLKELGFAPAVRPHIKDYDVKDLAEIESVRAVAQLIERAVVVLRNEAARKRTAARTEVLASIRPEREKVLSSIASALVQLREAVRSESELVAWLRNQDESLVDALRPPRFPVGEAEISNSLELIGGTLR